MSDKFQQTHNRYHVNGVLADGISDLLDTYGKKEHAFRHATVSPTGKPGGYVAYIVYDSMARKGAQDTWHFANGKLTKTEYRPLALAGGWPS